ncbi:MAG: iron-containing alcohol dehydrogenase [Chloroflexi bacterium]|nr:iron-containing alcohol dehydrogenase [Chloroflexota bacterium]
MSVWPLPHITFRELSSIEENRPVALLTTDNVWTVYGSQLNLPIIIQAEPARHDVDLFDSLADNLPSQVQAVYAVGSGAPVDAGKIVAARNNVPLIIVPTTLDSDAMLTPTALVMETEEREDEENLTRLVEHETGPAREILIDWGILEGAPENRRGAGIVDVLAIVTGLLDWRHAAQKGKNPIEQRFTPWAASVAAGLASQAIKSAGAIGQGNHDALETLLHLMMMSVQLSNQLGHTRARAGGEHYLARILASQVNGDLSHAEIVGPCMLLISALHNQAPTALREALEEAKVPLDKLRATDIRLTLNNIAALIDAYELSYSILNDIDPDAEQVTEALEAAGLAIEGQTWEVPPSEGAAQPTSTGQTTEG